MELVRGDTLRSKLRASAGWGLPLDVALRIARRVCRGLAFAHGAGIVHRDVKPANVMIGEAGEVKLLDFGIAKVNGPAAVSAASAEVWSRLTGEGMMLGTPGYMAPEQARGEQVDARADVFSLGVMLHEMLSGARPFQGDTPFDLVLAVEQDRPRPLAFPRCVQAERLRPLLEQVVLRCLEKDPRRRYADAADLLRDLGALSRLARMTGEPGAATACTPGSRPESARARP